MLEGESRLKPVASASQAPGSDHLASVLAPVMQGLEADGYRAAVVVEQGSVIFEISAGPDACAECLSPASVLRPMISHLLKKAGIDHDVDLRYPGEAVGNDSA